MKFSTFLISFLLIFVCLISVVFFHTDMIFAVNTGNIEYGTKIKSSCYSAIKVAQVDSMSGTLWDTQAKRDLTLNTFYDVLLRNFNAENTYIDKNMIELRVPIVMLIDTNGYYINRNTSKDLNELSDPGATTDFKLMSSYNAWSKGYGDYIVQFYLNNYVSVTTSQGVVYEGDRYEVVEKMNQAGLNLSSLSILSLSESRFLEEKNSIIITETNQTLESFINTQNEFSGNNTYAIQMPHIKGEDWSRMLENPTIIAFLQGDTRNYGRKNLNMYGFAGAELSEGNKYFITRFIGRDGSPHIVYHILDGNNRCDCGTVVEYRQPKAVYDNDGNVIKRFDTIEYRYIDADTPSMSMVIDRFYYSMTECVEAGGQTPCTRCVGQ